MQSRESQESSPTPQFKSINPSVLSFLCGPTLTSIHDYWKNHGFNYATFVGKVMCLFFSMLSRLVIAFLRRSKGLLISWLQSPSAVILEPRKIKSVTVSIVSPNISVYQITTLHTLNLHKVICQLYLNKSWKKQNLKKKKKNLLLLT